MSRSVLQLLLRFNYKWLLVPILLKSAIFERNIPKTNRLNCITLDLIKLFHPLFDDDDDE